MVKPSKPDKAICYEYCKPCEWYGTCPHSYAEFEQERVSKNLSKEGYITKTDNTLKSRTKDELIELIRCLEHNWGCAIERCERQYELLKEKK